MSKLRAERGSLCFGVKHEYEINKLLKVFFCFFNALQPVPFQQLPMSNHFNGAARDREFVALNEYLPSS